MDFNLVPGKLSKHDKVLLVSAVREPVSYVELGKMIALLARNEEVLTHDIKHYSQGASRLKEFLDNMFEVKWLEINSKEIEAEVEKIYRKFGKKGDEVHAL